MRNLISIFVFVLLIALIHTSHEGLQSNRIKTDTYIEGAPRFIINKIEPPIPQPPPQPKPQYDTSPYFRRP